MQGHVEYAVDGAAVFLRSLARKRIDPEQTWFWTSAWLSGELEVEREGETDPGVVYDDAEAFKAALRAARQ